jgi:subtilisin family serine protease
MGYKLRYLRIFVVILIVLVTGIGLDRGDGTTAAPSDPATSTQFLELGGQRITYTGSSPLEIEPGVYWDTSPATAQTALLSDSDGQHLRVWPGSSDEVRLIVQLQGEPLSASVSDVRQNQSAVLDQSRSAVLQSLAAQGLEVRVHYQFREAYNGLALSAHAGDMPSIAHTPGVRAVYPDYQVQALLTNSVPLIGAPAVWTMTDGGGLPVTGSGMRVAVIDSGIDYNHTDLGGPGFPNARVITGYNFIADTSDPWDDFGHGTHMAGAIGANGGVKGVAPGTSLMAYKIFDANGKGVTSDILAAIELALDPDGNPATQDSAHVINLSLGDAGTPNDPLSQACDHAVQSGVVVVVAGGNSGPRYSSTTSPGIAQQVISVGATNITDGIWTYSSRGPVSTSWAIKPDLIAPGIAITSTAAGGGYVSGTGTSIAAAHVSGAAALLRQLHPTWQPEWIKAALMNTAKDLGRSPFEQGAGRVQVNQAAITPVVISPPSLSLGRVDSSQPLWTRQETLVVNNVSLGPATYTFSIAGAFPTGVGITVNPTQVTVPAGEAVNVTFTLSVDPALTPDVANDPFAYWGAVKAVSSNLSDPPLRVPFAFFKAALLRLHVDEPGVAVLLLKKDTGVARYVAPVATTDDYLLPVADYDVVVQYRNPYAYVLQSTTLTSSGVAEVSLPRSAAIYQARIAFTGETGQPVLPNMALHRLMIGGNGWLVSETSTSSPIPETIYFSEFPTTYTWDRSVAVTDLSNSAYLQWHGRSVGISSNLEFLTSPADFSASTYRLQGQPGNAYVVPELFGYASSAYTYTSGPTMPAVTAPYTRRVYYRAPPSGHALYTVRYVVPDPLPTTQAGMLMFPWLQLDGDRLLGWSMPSNPADSYYRTPTGAEAWQLGPAHLFTRFSANRADRLRLVPLKGTRLYFHAYQGGDVTLEKRQLYELHQGDALISSGDIGSVAGGSQAEINLPAPGSYSLSLPFTYTLGKVTANGRAVATFDTSRYPADIDPPYLSVLRLMAAGKAQVTDTVTGAATLHLVIADAVDPAPLVLVDYNIGSGWTAAAILPTGSEYVANLPAFADGTAVSLRITITDASGNVLTHYLEPAYFVQQDKFYIPMISR